MTGRAVAPRSLLALSLLAIAAPVSGAQACACCGTYKVINVDEEDALNVRSGPGPSYGVRLRLAAGEGCIMKTGQRAGSWVQVEAQGIRGWVHGGYLGYIR